jgi:beta-lactamase superfamily II metal-dependent hydrolase
VSALVLRAYNVHFGDAIFLEVPDRDPATGTTTTRRILIDVGNVLNKEGGDDTVFQPAIDDIVTRLGGHPLDLYVLTHEHMDHCQGLQFLGEQVYKNGALKNKLKPQYAWLTASAEGQPYYDRFPGAKKEKLRFQALYDAAARFVAAHPDENSPALRRLLANNDYRTTEKCVAFLRTLAARKTTYVFRGCPLAGTHPFKEAAFEVWAPEEDTSSYYGRFQPSPLHLGAAPPPATARRRVKPKPAPRPPAGVDAGAFYNLVGMRARGFFDNLLAIDAAANNTSLVFSLTWRGWRLLFTGDAEIRSWKTMDRAGVLKPIHFLKVSHHSSHNGTPAAELLEKVLPSVRPDARARRAVISAWTDTYSGIPHGPTRRRLQQRCDDVVSILDDRSAPFVEMRFEAP